MRSHLEIKEEALDETSESYWFYENKKEGLGEKFLKALEDDYCGIIENPFKYQIKYEDKRIAVMRKFPFILIFEIKKKDIIIFAVFHTSRNPKVWKKRD